jgi:hypothetical protein
MQDEAGE